MATKKDGYSPYRGIWIIVFIILIIPVPIIYVFKAALGNFTYSSPKELEHCALMFAMIVASIFDLSLLLTGFLNPLIKEFFERLGILFKYLRIAPKNAIALYKEELHESGISLWIYLGIISFHIIFTIIQITSYISIYLIK